MHDHFKPYLRIEGATHSFCHAHHRRELKAIAEFDKEEWASKLDQWFLTSLAHRREAEQTGAIKLPKPLFDELKKKFGEILTEGLTDHLIARSNAKKTSVLGVSRKAGHNLIRRLLEHEESALRFLTDFDIPFTNNQAEQDIRMMKVKMKVSGCFRSKQGARNFAILRSVISTAKNRARKSCRLYQPHPPTLSPNLRLEIK